MVVTSLKGTTEGVVQLGWREPLLTQSVNAPQRKTSKQTKKCKEKKSQSQVP